MVKLPKILARIIYGIFLLPLVLITFYIWAWFIAAQSLKSYWPTLNNKMNINGVVADLPTSINIQGFPFNFVITIPGIKLGYKNGHAPWLLSADRIDVLIDFLRPMAFEVRIHKARQEFLLPHQPAMLIATMHISNKLNTYGRLDNMVINITDWKMVQPLYLEHPFPLSVRRAEIMINHKENNQEWSVNTQLHDIAVSAMPTSLVSSPIKLMRFHASVSNVGQGKNFIDYLLSWQKNNGQIVFHQFEMTTEKWAISSDNILLQLDQQLQPIARINLVLYDYKAFVNGLLNSELANIDIKERIQEAVRLLAAAQGNTAQNKLAVRMLIENKNLSVGPISIYTMPNLNWNYLQNFIPKSLNK